MHLDDTHHRVLLQAIDAYCTNDRRAYKRLLQSLKGDSEVVLLYVWAVLSRSKYSDTGAIVQVACDLVTKKHTDLLYFMWRTVDPPRLLALISLSDDLVPWNLRWEASLRSLVNHSALSSKFVSALVPLVEEVPAWTRRGLVIDLLKNHGPMLAGASLLHVLYCAPSGFVGGWLLEHLSDCLVDISSMRDEADLKASLADVACLLVMSETRWDDVHQLLFASDLPQRRIGCFAIAAHLGLKSSHFRDRVKYCRGSIAKAPPAADCRALLIRSELLVDCDVHGLG